MYCNGLKYVPTLASTISQWLYELELTNY